MAWYDAVFVSELGFFLHLPYWIDMSGTKAPRWLLKYVMVIRVLLNGVAMSVLLSDGHAFVGWLLLAISAVLYFLTYVIIVARTRDFDVAVQPALYGLSHISATNFLFDTPGRNIRAVRLSHAVVAVGSPFVVAVLLFTTATVTPLSEAWGCYDPAFIESLEDYKYGTCDQDICSLPQIDCSRKSLTFATASLAAEQAFVVLFIVQLLSVPAKLRYYHVKEA